MRFSTEYVKKKLNQLIDELDTIDEDDDHGWEWEIFLAYISRAKHQVMDRKNKENTND